MPVGKIVVGAEAHLVQQFGQFFRLAILIVRNDGAQVLGEQLLFLGDMVQVQFGGQKLRFDLMVILSVDRRPKETTKS